MDILKIEMSRRNELQYSFNIGVAPFRNIPINPPTTKTTCICCGNEAKHTVWFAQAY